MSTSTQPLERRRDKAAGAGAAADRAQEAVTDIDNQLKTIATLVEQQEQAVRQASDEIARLKRSLKAAGKRRAELIKQRKKAVDQAEQAQAKAAAAESKYDKVVLAELIRREKQSRAAAPAQEPAPAAPAEEVAARQADTKANSAGSATAGTGSRPTGDPEPEQPSEATATTRRTAARKTAKAARLIR